MYVRDRFFFFFFSYSLETVFYVSYLCRRVIGPTETEL